MSQISREKRKEYIKAGASFCINCGSGNISAGKIESEGREAWQTVQCYDCGSEWNDIFRLIGVDDITLPEDDPMIPVVFGNKESADEHAEPVEEVEDESDLRGAAFVMEMEIPVFKGCGELLAAVKQVIANWEHGDLAAAVRNLDLSVKKIEGKVTEKPRDVILLVTEFRNGRNFYVCEDSDKAIDELYEFVEEYWHELPADIGQIPSEKLDAIEIYYREKDGKESYEMQALPLLSGRDED